MNDFSPTGGDETATATGLGGIGQPVIHPATVVRPAARSPWRMTTIALLLSLLLGGLIGGWLVTSIPAGPAGWFGSHAPAASAAESVVPPAPATPAITVAPPVASIAVSSPPGTTIDTRVAILEERLARINIAAESASGNAARAESLLVAFGARRAIDRGLPLGVMEAQLRLRFGETQPNAVRSILDAAANPVLADNLRQRLTDLQPLAVADIGTDWFSRFSHRLAGLFDVRPANAPSTSPDSRFRHALLALDNGRLDTAIDDVAALPGHDVGLVRGWLTDARRLNDARRALEIIETAAILEPAENRTPDVAVPAQ